MITILISQIHYLLFLLKPKEWKIKRKKRNLVHYVLTGKVRIKNTEKNAELF